MDITGLPEELLLTILHYLDLVKDVARVSQASKKFYRLCLDNSVWGCSSARIFWLQRPSPLSTVQQLKQHATQQKDLERILSIILSCKLPTIADIQVLCCAASFLLKKESSMLHLSPPLTVVGSLHGHLPDLLEIFT